ncbi:MAG: hypothetical protein BWK79_14725 [Beggiatoa sp. IS2]|nr:MAG: hypothetical protein BWK79_14725 [Beggiatoa sp. IS2]
MRHLISILSLLTVIPGVVIAQEENDVPEGATATTASSKKLEALYAPTDVDFFRFDIRTDREHPELDKSGNLTATVSQKAPPGGNPNSGWRIDLYAENDLANSLYTEFLPETSLSVKFEQGLSPGRYYYKVSSMNQEVAPIKEYTLQSNWEESSYYERPPNDLPKDATVIKLNELYSGNLSSVADIDFYRFGLLNNDAVTLTFQQDSPGVDTTIGWTMELFSEHNLGLPLKAADVPVTNKAAVLQADLTTGVYYVRVGALPPKPVEDKETADTIPEKKAPVGRRYQLTTNAASVPVVDPCPLVFTYGQNPLTTRWTAFPSACDVPAGWASTQVAPLGAEVCPSPHAVYQMTDGLLTIPLVDVDGIDEATGQVTTYTYAVKLRQLPPAFQFELMMEEIREVK